MQDGWSPAGFEAYRDLYPATAPLRLPASRILTQPFSDLWHAGTLEMGKVLQRHASRTTVVLIRGFLGHCIPGNLVRLCAALRALGFEAFVAANRSAGTVAENASAVARDVGRRITRDRVLICAHSRGGVESMLMLEQHREIAARCVGLALSQTPHGPSPVLESVLQRRHRTPETAWWRPVPESLQRAGLRLLGAIPAGVELTSERWPSIVRGIAEAEWPFPVVQTASWSSQPTAWLDSFHARLSEIGPGRAHDGQYYLEDLIWPNLPHVLLPRVDHAQPVIGGHRFDVVRYWLALLALVLSKRDGARC